MKQLSHPLQALGALLLIFVFQACVKDNHGGRKIDEALKLCPIQTIQVMNPQYQPGVVVTQYDIHYNSAGNPVDIIQTKAQFHTADYYFRYDKEDRLTDFIGAFAGSQGAITWHVYTYPARNIIVDSEFNYVNLITDAKPDPSSYSGRSIYTLDKEGRIYQSEGFFVVHGISTFLYDDRGNRIWSGTTQLQNYDYKINPFRTNPVWQFIFNDYSRNNINTPVGALGEPIHIIAYNLFGLPQIYQSENGLDNDHLFGVYMGGSELHINYACDINPDAPGAVIK